MIYYKKLQNLIRKEGIPAMKETLARIQQTLDYIEDNLKTEISPQELSALAGFSPCHYSHLFTKTVGMAPGQYVNSRRLCRAIYEIGKGKSVLDAALEYGYETHAGFYRAFYREYGCSPTAYLKRHRPAKPYRIRLHCRKAIGRKLTAIKEAYRERRKRRYEGSPDFFHAGEAVADGGIDFSSQFYPDADSEHH